MNYKVFYRAICLSWIILIACLIIKAFGGDFFDLDVESTWLEEKPIVRWALIPQHWDTTLPRRVIILQQWGTCAPHRTTAP